MVQKHQNFVYRTKHSVFNLANFKSRSCWSSLSHDLVKFMVLDVSPLHNPKLRVKRTEGIFKRN